MAVAHDAASESHTGASGSTSAASFTWNHTPVGTPKGVLVYVMDNDIIATPHDCSTSVTYGGVAVPAVTGGFANAHAAGDPVDCKAYFLGSGIPTGVQAVVVNRTNDTDELYAVCITVTAGANTEYNGVVLLEGTGTLAEQSVDDGSPGANSVRYGGICSSLSSVPAAGSNSTALVSIDFGSTVAGTVRETTAGQGARSVGFSSGSSDGRAAVHLAVREVVGSGALTLQSVAGVASVSNLVVAAPAGVALGAVAGIAVVSNLVVSAPALVTLQSVAGVAAVSNLAVAAPAGVALDAAAGVATVANLAVAAPSLITMQPVAGVAGLPNVLLTANAYLTLASVDGAASLPNVALAAPAPVALDAAAGVATVQNLAVASPVTVALDAIAGSGATANLVIAAPAPLTLQAVNGVALVSNLTVDTDAPPVAGGEHGSILKFGLH